MKLFVYGTLRRGEHAHHLLDGAPMIASARTEPCFELAMMDGYPALVQGGCTAVLGEIYHVGPELLHVLDRYEEVPEFYKRTTLAIASHSCFAYVLPAHHALGRARIASGDWRTR